MFKIKEIENITVPTGIITWGFLGPSPSWAVNNFLKWLVLLLWVFEVKHFTTKHTGRDLTTVCKAHI